MKALALKFKNSSALKNILIIFFKIIISASILLFIIHSVSYKKIIIPLEKANYYYVLVSVLLLFPNIYLQYKRWQILCNKTLNEFNNRKILTSLFYGFSGGIFTPARMGEYVGRAICLNNSISGVTLATIIDKFSTLFILAFIGSISGLFFLHYFYYLSLYFVILIFLLILLTGYWIYASIFNSDFWEKLLFNRLSKLNFLKRYIEKLNSFHRLDKHSVQLILLLSVMFYLCFVFQFALLIAAFSNAFNIADYLWIGMLVYFTTTIIPPITFGELGIRESASVFFVVYFNLPEAVGLNASISIFIINVLIPALTGLILFLKKT